MRNFILIILIITACSTPTKTKDKIPKGIYYDQNIDTISEKQTVFLDSVGNYLMQNSEIKVNIIGTAHPSEKHYKNDSLNIAFSRAKKVSEYLTEKFKINSDRISLVIKVIGPALGENPDEYVPPEEKEFRKVEIEIE